jgi:hypothetical protein
MWKRCTPEFVPNQSLKIDGESSGNIRIVDVVMGSRGWLRNFLGGKGAGEDLDSLGCSRLSLSAPLRKAGLPWA